MKMCLNTIRAEAFSNFRQFLLIPLGICEGKLAAANKTEIPLSQIRNQRLKNTLRFVYQKFETCVYDRGQRNNSDCNFQR